MLDFVVWLIIFLIICAVILVFCYWVHLFGTRDSYDRGELIDFYNIIMGELTRLTGSVDSISSWVAMGLGLAVAWLLTLFGGWISPAAAGIPDYASNLATNYFFQSILFIGILHLMWPSFQDYAYDSGTSDSFLGSLVSKEVPFFFTLGAGLAAISLMAWGIHHKMSFIFCMANAISTALYAGFRVYSYEPDTQSNDDIDPYDSYDDADESYQHKEGEVPDEVDDIPDTADYSVYDQSLDDDAPEI